MSVFSRSLLSALFASGMAGYLLAIFMAYLGLHLDGFGTIAVIIGLIFFSRNFFQIFLRVPFGELAQIIGRKPLITSGTGFYTLSFFFMYLATSWVLVFFATVSVAIGMALYWPAMFSYIGDISTDDYGKINGYIFQGSDIGVIIGSFFSSYLLRNEFVDLNGLFGVGFIIGLVGTILIHFTLYEVLKDEDRKEVENIPKALIKSFKESLRTLIQMTKTKPLGKIYLFQLIVAFTEFFFNSFFPLIIVLYLDFTQSQVSDIIFITTAIIFFFKPYMGSISDRFGFRNPVLFALVINAICLSLLTIKINTVINLPLFGTNITIFNQFIFIIVIYGILVSSSLTSYLAVNGATSYAAGNSSRGMAMGALGFWVSFGRSSSSAILTPIWTWYEISTGDEGVAIRNVFQITSIIILICVFFLYMVSRNILLDPEKLT